MVIGRVCVVVQNANRWQYTLQAAPRNRQLFQIVNTIEGNYQRWRWTEGVPAGDTIAHHRLAAVYKDADVKYLFIWWFC
jgi:uncharacterized protein YbdZ (MbtH family)